MVAIKIQSLEDIIRAYLQNLGFKNQSLETAVAAMAAALGDHFNADNVLKSLDEVVSAAAGKIVRDKTLDKEQKLAAFKLAFLLCDGAEKWGTRVLLGEEPERETKAEIQQKLLTVVPEYQFSTMPQQRIETLSPMNRFKRKAD